MTITLPSTLTYGYVIGRFLLAVGDTPSDPDFLPDAVAAAGSVTFTSANPLTKEFAADPPTTVVRSVISCSIDSEGYLLDPAGNRGVWLVSGVYKVAYNLNTGAIAGHEILVLPEHTAESPMDLINHMPPGGPVLTVSQYAELSARIETKLPDVEWVGDTLSVDGEISPPLTGPVGPKPSVTWSDDVLVVEGESSPPLTGPVGPANSLSIGTVTTVSPATQASATLTGTSPEQVLNLSLPKGESGGIVAPAYHTGPIDGLSSGLYHCPSAQSVANGYPMDGWTGYLMVGVRSGAYTFQVAYGADARNGLVWVRTKSSATTWHPWVLQHSTGAVGGGDLTGTGSPLGVVTAPIGTYYTDTAGTNGAWRWLKKSGTGNTGWVVESGDTGLRNIGDLFTPEFLGVFPSMSYGRLRRIGDTVELSLNGISTSSGEFTIPGFLPSGFRPVHTRQVASFMGSSLRTFTEVSQTGTLILRSYSTGYVTPFLVFTTRDPWPTTLPGTPA